MGPDRGGHATGGVIDCFTPTRPATPCRGPVDTTSRGCHGGWRLSSVAPCLWSRPPTQQSSITPTRSIGFFVVSAGVLEQCLCRLLAWTDDPDVQDGDIRPRATKDGWGCPRRRPSPTRGRGRSRSVSVAHRSRHRHRDRAADSLAHGPVDIEPAPSISVARQYRDGSDASVFGTTDTVRDLAIRVQRLAGALENRVPQSHRRLRGPLVAGVVGLTAPGPLSEARPTSRQASCAQPPGGVHVDVELRAAWPHSGEGGDMMVRARQGQLLAGTRHGADRSD